MAFREASIPTGRSLCGALGLGLFARLQFVNITLTHEEIAQMIGSSRETVTRLLADFRKKQLLQVMGSTLVIKNESALESIGNG